jgi:ribosome biogenesis ATPase
MAPPRSKKNGFVVASSADEQKVYDMVLGYLEAQAEKANMKNYNPEEDGVIDFDLRPFIKKLSIIETVNFCKDSDFKFKRAKNIVITKMVEKAVTKIKLEQSDLWDKHDLEVSSDIEILDDDNMMEVKDTNQQNKSVVSLWNVTPAQVPTEDSTATSTPAVASTEKTDEPKKTSKKRERSSKDKESASKRFKDKSERVSTSSVTLKDLGGIDKIIEQVLEIIAMPLAHSEVYSHIRTETPRGVLLHGPPGCGKTMLANAIANELGVPFISVSAPSVVSGMSGESEKKLRDIFDEAKSLAPCIVFLDEIDAITPKRESVQREMERRIVAQLLTCMDDVSLEKTGGKPVIIIGATNRPDAIDSALRRGGRFDREICMSVPDEDSREKILRTICSKLRLEGSFDYKKLARMTPGYVGADLHGLVAAAGVAAIKRIFSDLTSSPAALVDTKLNDSTVVEVLDENSVTEDVEMKTPDETIDAKSVTEVVPAVASTKEDPVNVIQNFLKAHPNPLSAEELEPLAVTFEDFATALPTVQPSSKREGFATVPDVNWEDVGALDHVREELEYAIVEPIKNPELYKSVGVNAPSGVLLWGPPGCGKTLLAKAVAHESQANFISVRGPELLNKYVGESEKAVRQVFVRARASVPCVIFFDELDALVPHRDDTNSESSSRVVNTLLTELDGVGDRQGIFVVAATNRPDMIDSAMLRPGRLDKQLMVELPTPEERVLILKTVTRTTPLESNVDLNTIAHDERCRNFSGADLAALTREAAVLALKTVLKQRRALSNEELKLQQEADAQNFPKILVSATDFENAFKKVKPSVSDKDRYKYKKLSERLGTNQE